MPNLPAMSDASLTVYATITGGVNLLIAGAYLAAGIGGLKLRPIARRAMIGLSAFVLVWATALTIVHIVWVGPRTIAYSHQMQARMKVPANPMMTSGIEEATQLAGAIIGWVIWCALPICVLIFWRSRAVMSAFEGGSLLPPTGPAGAVWPPPPGPMPQV